MKFSERTRLLDFTRSQVLVVCPRCRKMASLNWVTVNPHSTGYRLVCPGCGRTEDWLRDQRLQSPPRIGIGPRLAFFNLDLWLQTPCAGHTLWVYNAQHLVFLEEYIAAPLREVLHDGEGWISPGGMGRRLPRWMLLAKHRPAVLRGLALLCGRLLGDA